MITSLSPQRIRRGTIKVITIASPEKIAPVTKYGGKIVVCHPGMTEVAKSKLTTVCTLTHQGGRQAGEHQVARLVVVPVPRRTAPAQGEQSVDPAAEPARRPVAERGEVGDQAVVPEHVRDRA